MKKTQKQQRRERDEAIDREAKGYGLPPLHVEIVNTAGEVAETYEVDDPRALWCAHFNQLWAGTGRTARPKISA